MSRGKAAGRNGVEPGQGVRAVRPHPNLRVAQGLDESGDGLFRYGRRVHPACRGHHPDVATGILQAGGKRLRRLGRLNLCDRSHGLLANTLDPVLDGLEQGPSRGAGRPTKLAKGQGGAELDPVAVIFEQPAAQAVDDLGRCAGKLGQNPGYLNFHLVIRVVEEVNQGVQVRCARLAQLAHRLDGGGSNQRVRVPKRGRDHSCCF